MAIALLSGFPKQAVSANSNNVTTAAGNSVGASLLVVMVSNYNGGGIVTTSDISEGGASANTWSQLTNQASGGGLGLNYRIFYVSSPNTNASHTVTITKTGGYPAVSFWAFSGTDTSTPYDSQENGSGTGGATTIQPGSVTPTGNGYLLVTGISHNDASVTVSIDSSFASPTQNNAVGGASVGIATSYYVQPTAGAINPTFTVSNSNEMACRIAVFKAAAGGATAWGPLLGLANNRLVVTE